MEHAANVSRLEIDTANGEGAQAGTTSGLRWKRP